jgi:hypothetical protein
MAYKLLYIDDEFSKTPDSVGTYVDLLQKNNFLTIIPSQPLNFEEQIANITNDGSISGIILDYRLSIVANQSGTPTNYDAPALAQELRTKSAENRFKEIPIFLISSDEKIKRYYDHDEASHDLFDFIIRKDKLGKAPDPLVNIIIAFIEAYESYKASDAVYEDLLKIKEINKINSSFYDKIYSLKDITLKFPIIKFLYKEFFNQPGLLVNKEIMAARLGLDINSEDFESLLGKYFANALYNGLFGSSSPRWWWHIVEKTWNEIFSEGKIFLRKEIASTRVAQLCKISQLQRLQPPQKLDYASSENFWTICLATRRPIDPIDGLKLYLKDNFPWQEQAYISFFAALTRMPPFEKISNNEKPRLEAIKKMLQHNDK